MGRLVAIVLAGGAACGSDDAATVTPDARVPDANLPDALVPDAFVQCDEPADCAGLAFTTVCTGGACRECEGNGDCGAAAFGPTCDPERGYCRCEGPSDCAGNANGAVCDPSLGACTCTVDGDCVTPATCQPQPYLGPGARSCQ